ncbi:MAG TPA: hypothetical protein VFV55_08280 [Usitatibacteraceae bacterium]|nr:hypothetical protein [Usitatibacteraceae bacterium]
MPSLKCLLPMLALAIPPGVLAAGDYVGVLRPVANPGAIAIPVPGFYGSPASTFGGVPGPDWTTQGSKLKLGYKYSKFFSVEAGYVDFGPRAPALFSGTAARGRGFTVETVGAIPLWARTSFYGRFGAWRSDGGMALLGGGDANPRPGAGLRYGLGLKYDLTRRVGFQAGMDHFSPLDQWGSREPDTDQVTLGVTVRF